MFFDTHTDILYDIVLKRMKGKKHIIKDFHLPQLLKGNITGGIWTYYTDVDHPLCEYDRALDFILDELEKSSDYINIVKENHDFKENKINVILGFESLYPIKDLHHFNEMYKLGFRHAMLTWNEENKYATGVFGTSSRGLTDLGKEVIKYMNEHHMIVDVSHTNVKSFYDICHYTDKPVIASHSNVINLCDNPRNLNDEQIKMMKEKQGTIGITAVANFVNPNEPTINNVVKHINYLKDKDMLEHIAIGFDFMDYLIEGENKSNLKDLQSANDAYNLIQALQRHGYNEDEINLITRKNALRVIKNILK